MRLFVFLIAAFFALPAQAAKLAFVLGNASYDALADLQNTHADARAYADAFEDLGYDIAFHRDLGLDAALDALDDFLGRVSAGDDVVVVYSGHGWSDGRTNYLVPTDAPKQGSDRLLKRRSIALRNGLNGILDELEAAGVRLTVAIIDACRDNPFAPTPGTRSTAISRGLAPVKAASGSFVIYSAGEGQQALDRLPDDPPGPQLSVFTRTFLPHLKSGVALERAISAAQVETAALAREVNGHLQHPAYYDQTLGDTCLAGSCRATPASLPVPDTQCDALFEKASATEACFAFQAYSDVCPNHVFFPMASAFLTRNCKPVPPDETAERDEPARRSRDEIIAFWASRGLLTRTRLPLPELGKYRPHFREDGRHLISFRKPKGDQTAPDFSVFDMTDPAAPVFDSAGFPKDRQYLYWYPDRYFLVGATGDVEVFETDTNRLVTRLDSKGRLGARLWFSYDADYAVAFWTYGGSEKPFTVIETATGKTLLEGSAEVNLEGYFWAEFSPDGSRLTVGGESPRVPVWDLATGQKFVVDVAPHLEGRRMGTAFFSADGQRLLVSTGYSDDRQMLDIEIASGRLLRSDGVDVYLWPMVLRRPGSPEPLRFGSSGDAYGLWRESDWQPVWSIDMGGPSYKLASTFDAELGLFAKISPDGELTVHDLFSGRLVRNERVEGAVPRLMDVLGDWRSLVVVDDNNQVSILSPEPR